MELEYVFFKSKEEARNYMLELCKSSRRMSVEDTHYPFKKRCYALEEGIERLVTKFEASYSNETKNIYFYLYNFKFRKLAFWRRYFSFFKFVKKSLENTLVGEVVKTINEEVIHHALYGAGISQKHHGSIAVLNRIFPELLSYKRIENKKIEKLLEE